MEANTSLWHSYLGVIVSRERQRMEHFQRAEDILLTLLESVHARDPRFLVDYARNLEALEFALGASEDAVTLELPLRIDGDSLRVLQCQGRDSPAGSPSELNTCCLEVCSPGTDLEDWTGVVDVMEHGGGAGCLLPGKILQHLKELLVSAIVHCQRLFLLQPGAYTGRVLPSLELPPALPGSPASQLGSDPYANMLGRMFLGVWPTQNRQEQVSEHLAVCWDGLCPQLRKGKCKLCPAILRHLHLGLMAPSWWVQGSPSPAVRPQVGFAQALGVLGLP